MNWQTDYEKLSVGDVFQIKDGETHTVKLIEHYREVFDKYDFNLILIIVTDKGVIIDDYVEHTPFTIIDKVEVNEGDNGVLINIGS